MTHGGGLVGLVGQLRCWTSQESFHHGFKDQQLPPTSQRGDFGPQKIRRSESPTKNKMEVAFKAETEW